MILKLKKAKIKNLSNNAQLKNNATPAIAGGNPIIDNTPTKYLQTCNRHTYDWQYSCGIGDGCHDVY